MCKRRRNGRTFVLAEVRELNFYELLDGADIHQQSLPVTATGAGKNTNNGHVSTRWWCRPVDQPCPRVERRFGLHAAVPLTGRGWWEPQAQRGDASL